MFRKKSKMGNVKVTYKGIKFDSKKELTRFHELTCMMREGKITNLSRQVPFELQPAFIIEGKKIRDIKYVADYIYTLEDGTKVVEDVKPYDKKKKKYLMTPDFCLKKKMFLYKYGDEYEFRLY